MDKMLVWLNNEYDRLETVLHTEQDRDDQLITIGEQSQTATLIGITLEIMANRDV